MANKLNLNAQNIAKMLAQKTPEDMAVMLDVILDDLATNIDQRLVCEFIFSDYITRKYIASSCYVAPPAKGEYIKIGKDFYEIVSVMHNFNRDNEAGSILVNKAIFDFYID